MRVLLVEDDSSTARSIEMILKSEGYMVESTDLGEDAYELGKFYEYDIIVLDLMLPYVKRGHAFTNHLTTNLSICWNFLQWNDVEIQRIIVSYMSNVNRV